MNEKEKIPPQKQYFCCVQDNIYNTNSSLAHDKKHDQLNAKAVLKNKAVKFQGHEDQSFFINISIIQAGSPLLKGFRKS